MVADVDAVVDGDGDDNSKDCDEVDVGTRLFCVNSHTTNIIY